MQLLLQRWQDPESGLDSARTTEYEVLLSFPSGEQPNRVDVGESRPWLRDSRGLGEPPGPAPTPPSLNSELHWGHPLLLPTQ